MKEIRDVDSMKYRKSTHLAGVDVEMIIHEKGSCILTIQDAYYSVAEVVNGKKLEGYYVKFHEHQKKMKVNSSNRQTISKLVKSVKNLSNVESRNLTNWIGQKVELYFKEDVKFAGEVVGGIRVKPINPIPNITDENALKVIGSSKTLAELQSNWGAISRDEQSLPSVTALKDKLKNELK